MTCWIAGPWFPGREPLLSPNGSMSTITVWNLVDLPPHHVSDFVLFYYMSPKSRNQTNRFYTSGTCSSFAKQKHLLGNLRLSSEWLCTQNVVNLPSNFTKVKGYISTNSTNRRYGWSDITGHSYLDLFIMVGKLFQTTVMLGNVLQKSMYVPFKFWTICCAQGNAGNSFSWDGVSELSFHIFLWRC